MANWCMSAEARRDSHYHDAQLGQFWPEYLRKLNPEIYRVNLSEEVWEVKQRMMAEFMEQHED